MGHTLVDHKVRIVEENAMIRIGVEMHIVVLHVGQVQLVDQGERVLDVYIVVGGTVHDQEAHILFQRVHVCDRRVIVSRGVVLRGVHVSFCVD